MRIFEFEGNGEDDDGTFFSLSGEYLEAAETLNRVPPTKINYWIVTYYLVGHSAELTLKSFLYKNKTSISELRNIGHDLSALIYRSSEFGLKDFSLIHELSPIYKEKRLEYRKRKKENFPSIEGLIKEVKQLRSIVFTHVIDF